MSAPGWAPDFRVDGARSNGERAATVAALLRTKVARRHYNDELDANISDVLADMIHLCDREDLDFQALVERAGRNYLDEQPRNPSAHVRAAMVVRDTEHANARRRAAERAAEEGGLS